MKLINNRLAKQLSAYQKKYSYDSKGFLVRNKKTGVDEHGHPKPAEEYKFPVDCAFTYSFQSNRTPADWVSEMDIGHYDAQVHYHGEKPRLSDEFEILTRQEGEAGEQDLLVRFEITSIVNRAEFGWVLYLKKTEV
jgi:hypothetical protein